MHAVLVVGTRPQIIKTAPIFREASRSSKVTLDIVHTGQHYDYQMSKVFFNELEMPEPIDNLGVGSGPHGLQTGRMLAGLEEVFLRVKPDLVLTPGDTNSALAAALAAVKMCIPVAHLESGARSFDKSMPEEVNRVLTDHCSDTLFAVSEWCRDRLLAEGIPEKDVFLVGDTMYDNIQNHMDDIDREDVLERLGIDEPYCVLTIHRAVNTDDDGRLVEIVRAMLRLDRRIVFPCHPRTRGRLIETGLMREIEDSGNILLVEPINYFGMLRLIRDSRITLTDSGGIQKEAFWLNTPCITLRDNTEWRETVRRGMNMLVGTDCNAILGAVEAYEANSPTTKANPYFFGGASKKIISVLSERYG